MRRIFDDAKNAVAAARRQTFFGCRNFFNRQAGIEKWLVFGAAKTDGNRQLPFRQCVGDLSKIAAQKKILLHKSSKVILALDLPHKRPQGDSRAADAHSNRFCPSTW